MVVTAAMSKTSSATSVTHATPASTRSRSWACRSRRIAAGMPKGFSVFIGALRVAGSWQAQAVADCALGMDQVRPAAGQLAPQVGDVRRDHGAGPAEVVVPHVVKQLGPGKHPAG